MPAIRILLHVVLLSLKILYNMQSMWTWFQSINIFLSTAARSQVKRLLYNGRTLWYKKQTVPETIILTSQALPVSFFCPKNHPGAITSSPVDRIMCSSVFHTVETIPCSFLPAYRRQRSFWRLYYYSIAAS